MRPLKPTLLPALTALCVALLTLSIAAANGLQDEITVLNADAVVTTTTTLAQSLVDSTAGIKRMFLQYAEHSQKIPLRYPADLIDDSNPPQASHVAARMVTTDTAIISWSTDEFANSAVMYGTQPGVYEFGVTRPLYVREHQVTLSGLLPEMTYFYKVRSTDLNGNTYESSEHSFVAHIRVYLPLIFEMSG